MQDQETTRDLVERSCIRWESDIKTFLLGTLRDAHLVDDAFQKTVVKAIQAADSVRTDSIRGWLFQIALNEARQIRRVQRKQPGSLSGLGTVLDAAQRKQWVELGLIGEETVTIVKVAIERLPAGQKEVVHQRLIDGCSFAEIAEGLERPIGTVLTWMHRGLQRLRSDITLRSLWEGPDYKT